jgi:hypothetical protein
LEEEGVRDRVDETSGECGRVYPVIDLDENEPAS